MLFETWLAYAVAATVIIVIPGPTVLLIVSQAMRHGYAAALPLVAGVAMGDLIAMAVSLAGIGFILTTSAAVFTIVKYTGAVYLIYLGIRMWRSPSVAATSVDEPQNNDWRRHFVDAFLVTLLNPKGMVFFLAFIPQFINPESAVLPQLTVFGVTFLVIATASAGCYAVFSAQAGKLFRGETGQRWITKIGGSMLVAAGAATAALRQES
ncbi:MAG: LysE family translocator [Pseudomonadota bacterium]